MSKIELSISKDYVQTWGMVEATREIFQNAIDQETNDPDNAMSWGYDYTTKTLTISSSESSLERRSLLLGASTKNDDPNTIGKFGEGYKLALMVLLRAGYDVTIHNYGAKEVWKPKLEHSSAYNETVLSIHIDKWFFKSVPDSNLSFIITGITQDDMVEIHNHNLHIHDEYPDNIETDLGNIITDKNHVGIIYVNGLFVERKKDIKYGYDFRPHVLEIDRDRRMVSDLDLLWETSSMWGETEDNDVILDMLKSDTPDVKYLHNRTYSVEKSLPDKAHKDFLDEHGDTAIPVTYEHEAVEVRKLNLTPIITTDTHAEIIKRASTYVEPKPYIDPVRQHTPHDMMSRLLNRNGKAVSGVGKRIQKMLKHAKQWDWK